jgi:hypothetical protein
VCMHEKYGSGWGWGNGEMRDRGPVLEGQNYERRVSCPAFQYKAQPLTDSGKWIGAKKETVDQSLPPLGSNFLLSVAKGWSLVFYSSENPGNIFATLSSPSWCQVCSGIASLDWGWLSCDRSFLQSILGSSCL